MDSSVFLPRSISEFTCTMSLIDAAEGEKNHLNFTFSLSSDSILHIFDHIRTQSLQRKSGLTERIMFHHVVNILEHSASKYVQFTYDFRLSSTNKATSD